MLNKTIYIGYEKSKTAPSHELQVADFYSPFNETVVVRAVVSRDQQSCENIAGIAGRFGTLSLRQKFNDLSTSLFPVELEGCNKKLLEKGRKQED